MKILMVNSQLYTLGGSETYMFGISDELQRRGHAVQFFGKRDPADAHGNNFGIYAKSGKTPWSKIVNRRNCKLFGQLLDKYKPDLVHFNLVYFALTPAIIQEAVKRNIPTIHTVHDPKIVCANHRLFIEKKNKPCMECLDKGFSSCTKNRCIRNSLVLSVLASAESYYHKKHKTYEMIDMFVFPSDFMRKIHIEQGINKEKSITIRNYSRIEKNNTVPNKKPYVLYFGRLGEEKGIRQLVDVAKMLPNVNFVFAGKGELNSLLESIPNCEYKGFVEGNKLRSLIEEAKCAVFPSVWYENCPMSILESIALGTPVIGSNKGGIPELIEEGITGFVFSSADTESLKQRICEIYFNEDLSKKMASNCISCTDLMDVNMYVEKLIKVYEKLLEDRA